MSPRPGIASALVIVAVSACVGYSFRSPIPAHLETLYVGTFENETREFQLTQEITERVINEFLNESGLQLVGSPDEADLVIRGTIREYEEEALSYDPRQTPALDSPNPDVFSRRVILTLEISLEDQIEGETLWESSSMREWGEFSEEQGETREDGIDRAVEKIAETLLRNTAEEF